MILSKYDRQFLEENKDLIADEKWDDLYTKLRTSPVIIKLYDILKEAGIDLINDYHMCPRGCAAHCTTLPSDLNIPEGVSSIGNAAFFGTSIEKVHLPSTIKTIGNGAFSSCENLTSINIPASVENLGVKVFRDC